MAAAWAFAANGSLDVAGITHFAIASFSSPVGSSGTTDIHMACLGMRTAAIRVRPLSPFNPTMKNRPTLFLTKKAARIVVDAR